MSGAGRYAAGGAIAPARQTWYNGANDRPLIAIAGRGTRGPTEKCPSRPAL